MKKCKLIFQAVVTASILTIFLGQLALQTYQLEAKQKIEKKQSEDNGNDRECDGENQEVNDWQVYDILLNQTYSNLFFPSVSVNQFGGSTIKTDIPQPYLKTSTPPPDYLS